jgi:tRNA (cytidine/uridine-2'-O-)-methyltransferase
VKPLGFELTDRYLKRAGLDYWPYVKLHIHESLADLIALQQGDRWVGFTVNGQSAHHDFVFQDTDWLLFGSETAGLPPEALDRCDARLYIPMREPGVRSLNLSVSVAVGLFEAYRQIGFA